MLSNTFIKLYFFGHVLILYLILIGVGSKELFQSSPFIETMYFGLIGLLMLLLIFFSYRKIKTVDFLKLSLIKVIAVIGILFAAFIQDLNLTGLNGILAALLVGSLTAIFPSLHKTEQALWGQLKENTYLTMKKNEVIDWGIFSYGFFTFSFLYCIAKLVIPTEMLYGFPVIIFTLSILNILIKYRPIKYLPFFGSILLFVLVGYYANNYLTLNPFIVPGLSVIMLFVMLNYVFQNPDLNIDFQGWWIDNRNAKSNLKLADETDKLELKELTKQEATSSSKPPAASH